MQEGRRKKEEAGFDKRENTKQTRRLALEHGEYHGPETTKE
jgi:hypothetical protein